VIPTAIVTNANSSVYTGLIGNLFSQTNSFVTRRKSKHQCKITSNKPTLFNAETEDKSRHIIEHKGSLDVEIYTVVKTHFYFCLEEGCRMFSEISVLTYQTEKTHNPVERKMNKEEMVFLINTEDLNFERLRNKRWLFYEEIGKN
jgi:hypothetical protein